MGLTKVSTLSESYLKLESFSIINSSRGHNFQSVHLRMLNKTFHSIVRGGSVKHFSSLFDFFEVFLLGISVRRGDQNEKLQVKLLSRKITIFLQGIESFI